MRRRFFLIIAIITLLPLIFTGCFKNKSNDQEVVVIDQQKEKIPLDLVKDGYFKGPQNARVTIVEFSDFQCPACSQMNTVMQSVLKDYPDQVRLVFRHFPLPFHQFAKPAALAAEAAGKQGKFWEMVDLIFNNQKLLSEEKLEDWAKTLQLNLDQFNQDRQSQELNNKVEGDFAEAQELEIDGTPTFYINNREYQGDYSLQGFKQEIEEILRSE